MESNYIENKKKYIGVLGAFGLSVGTSVGWGSFVVTGSDYLSQAGLLGSIIGILLGALLMGVIAVGMAENMGGETFMTVYHRADEMMYANKRELKKKRPGHSLR